MLLSARIARHIFPYTCPTILFHSNESGHSYHITSDHITSPPTHPVTPSLPKGAYTGPMHNKSSNASKTHPSPARYAQWKNERLERYNKIRILLLADDLVDSFPRRPCRSFEPFFFNEFGDVQVTDTSYGERLVSLIDTIICT